MPGTKYGKYVVSNPKVPDQLAGHLKETAYLWKNPAEVYLDGQMVPGCPVWFDLNWVNDTHLATEPSWIKPHKHEQNEVLLFIATNPEGDLGGEIEISIGEGKDVEKHTFRHTTFIYLPAGLMHCPIIYKTFDKSKPQLMMALLFNPEYVHSLMKKG
jgi:hypothetical protein